MTTDKRACDGSEDIKTLQSPYTDTSQFRITNMVYKAVYAIAHAIHNVMCQNTNSTLHCDKNTQIKAKKVSANEPVSVVLFQYIVRVLNWSLSLVCTENYHFRFSLS